MANWSNYKCFGFNTNSICTEWRLSIVSASCKTYISDLSGCCMSNFRSNLDLEMFAISCDQSLHSVIAQWVRDVVAIIHSVVVMTIMSWHIRAPSMNVFGPFLYHPIAEDLTIFLTILYTILTKKILPKFFVVLPHWTYKWTTVMLRCDSCWPGSLFWGTQSRFLVGILCHVAAFMSGRVRVSIGKKD